MIVGVPQADIRKQIKADLERQIDAFLNRGSEILEVPPGASKEAPFFGTTGRTLKLRKKRDASAPAVRELADQGMCRKEIAATLGFHADTVALIGKENSITIAAGQ
jgi:hypothetical protein